MKGDGGADSTLLAVGWRSGSGDEGGSMGPKQLSSEASQ